LRVGQSISRITHDRRRTSKEGRSGPLVFVLVRHEVSDSDGVALTEEHDIVYREMPSR